MATFLEISSLRLELDDPAGFIDIGNVAALINLPAAPTPQTVYLVDADGSYMATEIETGATPADYARQELFFSDDTIGDLIDTYGIDLARIRLFKLLMPKLIARLQLIRNQTGTEDIEYISLKDKIAAIKDIIKDLEDDAALASGTNTGKYLSTGNPTIAGGDI